jgi:hypothetical protein
MFQFGDAILMMALVSPWPSEKRKSGDLQCFWKPKLLPLKAFGVGQENL